MTSSRSNSAPWPRDRPQELLCVGMLRIFEKQFGRGPFDDTPEIHDVDPIHILGHHRHVVGDVDRRHVLFGLKFLDQLENLRLHGHVEGRRRLVGDEELRARRRAPSRSWRAGAFRRRVDADIGRWSRPAPGCRRGRAFRRRWRGSRAGLACGAGAPSRRSGCRSCAAARKLIGS